MPMKKRIKFTQKLNKFNRRDKILLLERLELYISSGLPIVRALMVAEEGISERQKILLQKIRDEVESGGSFSRALTAYARIPKTACRLISHGETIGELGSALAAAKNLLEKEDELLKKCLSALAYPIIIAIFAGLLTIGLVRGVMPQIIPMLKSLNVHLPLLTRVVMAISDGLLMYGLWAFIGTACAITIFVLSYKKWRAFRLGCHIALNSMPIIGNLARHYSLAVFSRSCGLLIQSGISSSGAYADTVAIISLLPLRKMLVTQIKGVREGQSISQALRGSRIPPYIAPLLSAGEATGALGLSLIRCADILDRDIEHSLKRLTSLIEPVMMAGMGCTVGAIALSIMMPIYDISKALQK